MKTNIYSDEDGKMVDPVIGDLLERLIEAIVGAFSDSAKVGYIMSSSIQIQIAKEGRQ